MALDSYNGFFLWSLEIPHLRRLNLPRDASNMCADDDSLYLAVKDACWQLDGDTGLRTQTHKLGRPGHDVPDQEAVPKYPISTVGRCDSRYCTIIYAQLY